MEDPSLFHNSVPQASLRALKNRVPSTSVSSVLGRDEPGRDERGPGKPRTRRYFRNDQNKGGG
jgi:hypothetical protein